MITYRVWRRHHSGGRWLMTCHFLQARTDDEAAAKLTETFAHADFHSMSLVAVPEGIDPNANLESVVTDGN